MIAEDTHCVYGEISYGKIEASHVPYKIIGKNKYFKYWYWQGINKKINGKVGGGTNYDIYLSKIPNTYNKYLIDHKIYGKIFKLNKSDIDKIFEPFGLDNECSNDDREVIEEISGLLGIAANNIKIGGSDIFNHKISSGNDIDTIIFGLASQKKAFKHIRSMVQDSRFSLIMKSGKAHHRRFVFKNKEICPYAVSKKDVGITKFKLDQELVKVEGKVVDDSKSLLTPAIYTIMVDGFRCLLISYHVGHLMLFKKGDKITFIASKFLYTSKKIIKNAYIIPIEGTWVSIESQL